MKTYTTRSNAKRAAGALQAKHSFISKIDTAGEHGFFFPVIHVANYNEAIGLQLDEVALVLTEAPAPLETAPIEIEHEQVEIVKEAPVLDVCAAHEEDIEANNRREVMYDPAGNAIDPLKTPVIAEFSHCPSCSIHLSNGVTTYADLVSEGAKGTEEMTHEFMCLACGHEFGPEINRQPVQQPTPRATKEVTPHLNQSSIERPCKQVWHIAEEMFAANPSVKRKEVVAECERRGIAHYTARTQYQSWLSVRREQEAREAQQAAAKK